MLIQKHLASWVSISDFPRLLNGKFYIHIYISLSIISNTIYLLSVLFPFCLKSLFWWVLNIYNVAPNLLIIKQKRPVKNFHVFLDHSYFIFKKLLYVIYQIKILLSRAFKKYIILGRGARFSGVRIVVSDALWPHGLQNDRLPCLSPTPQPAQTHVHWVGDAIQPSHPVFFPSPPVFSLSQHQVKNPPASSGDIRDVDSIPGSGRSPGEGHGNPFQHSCLENPMDRGAWRAIVHGVAKTWTQHAHTLQGT